MAINDDGTNDVLIGAPYSDDNGSNSGTAYLVSGQATGVTDLGSSSNVIATIIGDASNDIFGRSVGPLGDVDGDGKNDIVIGAKWADDNGQDSGSAYVFLGDSLSGTINSSTANSIFSGTAADDEIGTAVTSIGDIDGSGKPDFIIGGHHYSTGGTNRGAAFIIFGENY